MNSATAFDRAPSMRVLLSTASLALMLTACGDSSTDWEVRRSAALSSRIDSLFAGFDRPESPGGIVAVLHRGDLVHLDGYGSINREFGVPWTPDARYRIASITKGFTGHATLLLADRGLLGLDDSVRAHLPAFPAFRTPVRVRHLLTMTSGIWYDEWLLPLAGVTGHTTLDEMYSLVIRQEHPNYTPGTAYNYIDTNSRLMARIIERVTNESWQEALDELIFAPLGMDATSAPPEFAQVFDRQGTTYVVTPGGGAPLRLEFPFHTSGDGSLLTTFADFIRWLRHLREGFENGTSVFDRLKGPTTIADGTELPYGYGLGEVRHRGLRGWGHGGATGTEWVFFPEIDLIVAVFTNYLGAISPTAVLTGATDGFLASEINPDPAVLTEQNPLRDQIHPRGPVLADRHRARLTGTFVDPETGYYLRSRSAGTFFGLEFLGAGATVVADGECAYRAHNRVHIPPLRIRLADCEVEGAQSALIVHWGDWPRPKRFVRVEATSSAVRRPSIEGAYYAERIGVHYRVSWETDRHVLRIGAGIQGGQRFELTEVLPNRYLAEPTPAQTIDILALPTLAVRFGPDLRQRVTTMHVSAERVRELGFVKQ